MSGSVARSIRLRPRLRVALAALLLGPIACAHQTLFVKDGVEVPVTANVREVRDRDGVEPMPLTVAVSIRSFESQRLRERAFIERFARALRGAGLFVGLMYPVPPGLEPLWELQLLVRDGGVESGANLWKAALSQTLPPVASTVWLENDYWLEVEALLVRRPEVVRSYAAKTVLRHRYRYYANRAAIGREGLTIAVDDVLPQLIDAIFADRETILAEDRARAGR